MFKKITSLALALAMVLSLLPGAVKAEAQDQSKVAPEDALVEELMRERLESLEVNVHSTNPDLSSESGDPIMPIADSVAINETNFPDANFRSYISSNIDTNGDGTLSSEELACTEIKVQELSISSLKGIEYFTALTTLSCYDNTLDSLDLSQNTALVILYCYSNRLKSLNITNNTALQRLGCHDNLLESLDVSKNTALTDIFCQDNKLESLNVTNNPELKYLACQRNNLSTLDLTKNAELDGVFTYTNPLTSLDVSQNMKLKELSCSQNGLTSLDVSANTELTSLYCYSNQLTSLDVSANTELTSLRCYSNQLTSLDLSNNTELEEFDCTDNAYGITLSSSNTFDLSTLPGKFQVNKASNWINGSVSGNTLTITDSASPITYDYNCGNSKTVTFTLKTVAREKTYLALGDSIPAGVTLNNPQKEAYPVLLNQSLDSGYPLVNLASDIGETTEILLEKLETEDYQAAIAQADLITITIGGSDIFALIYEFIADGLGISVAEVKEHLAYTTDLDFLNEAAEVINQEASGHIITEVQVNAILESHRDFIAAVRAKNSSALLVVSTQYNPYKETIKLLYEYYDLLVDLGPQFIPLIDAIIKINDDIETALNSINAAIKAGSGYSVADIYTEFANSSDSLCNANVEMSGFTLKSVNLDYHPNAAGHEVIARCMAETITSTHIHTGGTATCQNQAVCEKCGEAYGDLAAHTWDDGVVTTKPTENAPGVRTYTCTVCGETKTEEIAANTKIWRVAGSTRVETALKAADVMKDELGVSKFSNIIVASGMNFADALAGSYLAAKKEAPILLYLDGNPANVDYIQNNLSSSGTVYILGGTSAVKQSFETDLTNAGIAQSRIKRLAGATRFETNLLILEEAGVSSNDEILVATAFNFADCLSASATGQPILMVNTSAKKAADMLTDAQRTFLKDHADNQVVIIGGTSAVSDAMEAEIEQYLDWGIIRLSGSGREATSVEVAKRYFSNPTFAVAAYSMNFPDGLCGGPLAYLKGAPLLLTRAGQEAVVANYIKANGITSGYIMGGDDVVSDESTRTVFGIPAENDIPLV